VNVGAAGTFVVRRPVAQARLRRELARALPFDADVMLCRGRDVLALTAERGPRGTSRRTDLVPFVSILAGSPRSEPSLPLRLPPRGRWLLRIRARLGRFVLGTYRREMKAIGRLGEIDRLFGVRATTRNWSTIQAVAKILEAGSP
jgi:hypothetical protein